MGVKIIPDKRCNVLGCNLSYNHSGMHQVEIIKHNRRKCSVVTTMDDSDNKSAILRTSPCTDRSDELVSQDSIEKELMKTRLVFLKKTIDDLIQLM